MNANELMKALINGKALVDVLDYEPGRSSNGGRYSFTYKLDRNYRLWVICSYEGSEWEQVSDKLLETWEVLKGINWTEGAIWMEGPRWQVR